MSKNIFMHFRQKGSFDCAATFIFCCNSCWTGQGEPLPRGEDSLRVINHRRIIWLNVTGSGNETSAQLLQSNRMTLMFCSFSGLPMILLIYGYAMEITPKNREWNTLYSLFYPLPGYRQTFDLQVELVQNPCGTAVPLFDHVNNQDQLNKLAEIKAR